MGTNNEGDRRSASRVELSPADLEAIADLLYHPTDPRYRPPSLDHRDYAILGRWRSTLRSATPSV